MKTEDRIRTQVLVIGGGAAGIRAGLAAAEAGADTTVVCKGAVARSGITITAGGGIQAPFHESDSEDLFFADVVKYGYGLADEDLVDALVRGARDRVLDLERYGVAFRKEPDGSWLQFKMPGQSAPRNVRLAAEGVGLTRGLHRALLRSGATLLEDFVVVDLLRADDGSVAGAVGVDVRRGALVEINAPSVVIATGGCQSLWEVTDCPADATGDGLMHAYRCGAELVDLEMILFYPSVVIHPPSARGSFVHYEWLETWACDGEIRDRDGVPVLPKPFPVRDVAMRTMWHAIEDGRGTEHGGLWWDATQSPKGYRAVDAFLQGQQYRYLRDKLGVDPSQEKVEVAPGAHYQLGGIRIDRRASTGIPGLYAVPEAAGNVEGANRLSGSALAATQVFGEIAGRAAADLVKSSKRFPNASPTSKQKAVDRIRRYWKPKAVPYELPDLRSALRRAVGRYLGLRRSADGLEDLGSELEGLSDRLRKLRTGSEGGFQQSLLEILELENMLDVAELLRQAALLRQESRGHHYRSDFPRRDDALWTCHTLLAPGEDGPKRTRAPIRRSSAREETPR